MASAIGKSEKHKKDKKRKHDRKHSSGRDKKHHRHSEDGMERTSKHKKSDDRYKVEYDRNRRR